jgi:protein-disulfide isomerase
MQDPARPVRQWLSTVAVLAALLGPLAVRPCLADGSHDEMEAVVKGYLEAHPDEVGEIVKGYLIRHPEALREALLALIKHPPRPAAGEDMLNSAALSAAAADASAVADNASALFSSPHQATVGDPNGDVTLVEFFDYNCGFCKRALSDLAALADGDRKLKIVLKELPILGPGSLEAARVSIAARMLDPTGEKFFAFHRMLLGAPGPANGEKALAIAQETGFDVAQLRQETTNSEVQATLNESVALVQALGISGTPGYVIGKKVVRGAVGLAALKSEIEFVRR